MSLYKGFSSGMSHKSSSFEEFDGFSEIDVHFSRFLPP